MHMPIPEGAKGGALQLHAQPGTKGEIAAKASASRLVLSHFMARSLRNLESNVAVVQEAYDGEIVVGSDLACVALAD
jgi:ribonuclease BN (tRNA processing enzyme)